VRGVGGIRPEGLGKLAILSYKFFENSYTVS
jgi:hypothetical protein